MEKGGGGHICSSDLILLVRNLLVRIRSFIKHLITDFYPKRKRFLGGCIWKDLVPVTAFL